MSLRPRENAVDHTATITALAPSSSSTKVQVPPTPLELRVGKLVGLAASAVAACVRDGGLTAEPKLRAARLVAELFEVRRLMTGAWDFDGIAHQHGRKWLFEASGPDEDASGQQRIIDELVNSVMLILHKLVLSELN